MSQLFSLHSEKNETRIGPSWKFSTPFCHGFGAMAPNAKAKGTAEHGNQGPEGWQGPTIFLSRMGFVGGNYRVTQSKTIRKPQLFGYWQNQVVLNHPRNRFVLLWSVFNHSVFTVMIAIRLSAFFSLLFWLRFPSTWIQLVFIFHPTIAAWGSEASGSDQDRNGVRFGMVQKWG